MSKSKIRRKATSNFEEHRREEKSVEGLKFTLKESLNNFLAQDSSEYVSRKRGADGEESAEPFSQSCEEAPAADADLGELGRMSELDLE